MARPSNPSSMPSLVTTQVTEINKDRAALLYTIIVNKTIDMGQVIHDSIQHAIQGSLSGRLSHPSLIGGLCKEAKVMWTEDEIFRPPRALINNQMMSYFKV